MTIPGSEAENRRRALRNAAAEKLRRVIVRELCMRQPVMKRPVGAGEVVHADTNAIFAIAAGGSRETQNASDMRLTLVLDRGSAGNRWFSPVDAVDVWESTGAGVDVVIGAEGRFATVDVVAIEKEDKGLPSNWRFEAVALGPDEMPDPHRKIGNPKMDGMAIPLITTGRFRLDQPIRVALYVSDAGQTSLGCLVFVPSPE